MPPPDPNDTRPTEASTGAPDLGVLVTGATGFVGYHTALALRDAGHRVRILARTPEKARRAFSKVGLDRVDIVKGDMTDGPSVTAALDGCDAVVHSAAMVSVHARDADDIVETNVGGARRVLEGALERGIDRLVHVSSVTALFRPDARRIDEQSPLGDAVRGYGASKIACEKLVRGLQDQGAPIQITYPASVIGPDDPGLSEAMAGLKAMLENRVVTITTSGIQYIDVRDIALAQRLLIERGGPPDRFLIGGHYLTWTENADALEELVGERLLRIPMPAAGMRLLGAFIDGVDRFADTGVPMTREASEYATDWAVADDRYIRSKLGIEWRAVRESLGDAIAWLRRTGQLNVRKGWP